MRQKVDIFATSLHSNCSTTYEAKPWVRGRPGKGVTRGCMVSQKECIYRRAYIQYEKEFSILYKDEDSGLEKRVR